MGTSAKVVADESRKYSNPDENVKRSEDFAEIRVGHVVTIPNCRKRYDTEIIGIQPRKVLNHVINHRTKTQHYDY